MEEPYAEFEVWLDDEFIAYASGYRNEALKEALNYYNQYFNDGKVELFEVTRKLIPVVKVK